MGKNQKTVHTAVHFLDNIIDANKYPFKTIEEKTKQNRKIGLGIMGFADMLIKFDVVYGSEESIKIAENVMKFIDDESKKASAELGKKRGNFPNFKKSIFYKKYKNMRNATTTAIAPTGSISIIAGCSSGIEPLFAVCYMRKILGEKEFFEVNPLFSEIMKNYKMGHDVLKKINKNNGSLKNIHEVPKNIQKIFVTAHEIKPEQHLKVQSVFQKYADNAVSKTINLPNKATRKDIKKIFMLAYKLRCKGITVYRDRSKPAQVLNVCVTC